MTAAQWVDDAFDSGEDGGSARDRIFREARAQLDGPVARRLLALVTDERPGVRRAALAMLAAVCPETRTWPAGARAAERAFEDSDDQVRRAAATLLAAAGELDRCSTVLDEATDPVLRVALAEAMTMHRPSHRDRLAWLRPLLRLRDDPVPAIRVLANLAALDTVAIAERKALDAAGVAERKALDAAGVAERKALDAAGVAEQKALDTAGVAEQKAPDAVAAVERRAPGTSGVPERAVLDAAIRADLDGAEGLLGVPGARVSWSAGERWSHTFYRPGRDDDNLLWADRLLDPAGSPAARRTGVILAHTALRNLRDAPALLTPGLAGLLTVEPSALPALTASLTATRLAADRLAGLLDDPGAGATVAVALGCVGDERAVPYIASMMRTASREPRLPEALVALAPTSAALVEAARRVVAAAPAENRGMWWETAHGLGLKVLITAGRAAAPAVPELVARLRMATGESCLIEALRGIGPAARPAIPLLERVTNHADPAMLALLWISGDRGIADRYLAERPEDLSRGSRLAPSVLSWLVGHGGLTDRQHRQLRALFVQERWNLRIRAASALWRHEGPAAADLLLRELPRHLGNPPEFGRALRVLGAMGPYARPVLPMLDELIGSRRRRGFTLPDEDEELRADEALRAAAVAARASIAGPGERARMRS